MNAQAEEHTAISRDFFIKAGNALADDDLLQASEKGWGAAAHMVKAVAERRGWDHARHRQLYQVANRLAQETDDQEIRTLFEVANGLHSNFYENWMPKEMVADDLAQVKELLRRLQA